MTYYRFPDSRLTRGLLALLVFAILYLARDTLVTSVLLGFYRAQFLMLGICGLTGLVFLWYHRKKTVQILTDRRMALLAICAAVALLPMVLKRDWQMMYFSILLCMAIPVFFSYFAALEELAKPYVLILTALSAFSLVATYLLRILPDSGILPAPIMTNIQGVEFYNYFLSFVTINYVKMRNFGIFREPGVYQFFLILGLYLTQYRLRWEKPWHMWTITAILSITMLSTFATGGVLELLLLALVVFFDKKLYRNKVFMAVLVITVLLLAAAAPFVLNPSTSYLYWVLHDMVIGKFIYQQESVGDRVGSLAVNMELILRSPLFGNQAYDVLYSIANNTSSTLILFAMLGIGGGLIHLAAWFALIWRPEQKLWVNLSLMGILLISFNTQNIIADVFLWLFPMMALAERVLPKLPSLKKKV